MRCTCTSRSGITEGRVVWRTRTPMHSSRVSSNRSATASTKPGPRSMGRRRRRQRSQRLGSKETALSSMAVRASTRSSLAFGPRIVSLQRVIDADAVLLDLYDTLAYGMWPEIEHRLSARLGVSDDV